MKKYIGLVLSLVLVLSVMIMGCGKKDGTEEVKEWGGVFTAHCVNASGEPVAEAVIELCTDTTCYTCTSDENGTCNFVVEEGTYTLHILSAPQGVSFDAQKEYVPEAGASEMDVVF